MMSSNFRHDNQIDFEITESIANIGIVKFILKNADFEFTWSNETKCCVAFNVKESSIGKVLTSIEKRLFKEVKGRVNEDIFEFVIRDIENQLIDKREEIFNLNKKKELSNSYNKFNTQFLEDVSRLREQFENSSNPYKEWQEEVKKNMII